MQYTRRNTRACQGKCPDRNTSALAVTSVNNTIIYIIISAALADATNGLSMPCHEQRTGAVAGCLTKCYNVVFCMSILFSLLLFFLCSVLFCLIICLVYATKFGEIKDLYIHWTTN